MVPFEGGAVSEELRPDGLFISRAIVDGLTERIMCAAMMVSDGDGLVVMAPRLDGEKVRVGLIALLGSALPPPDLERPDRWTLRVREDCPDAAAPCGHLARIERMSSGW